MPNNPSPNMSAEAIAKDIPFDRAGDHHDGNPTHDYCNLCNVCKDCTENAIVRALTAFGERRFEEGKQEANTKFEADKFGYWADTKKEARREAIEQALKAHEENCNTLLDDESDQVLSDYQMCTCDRNKAIRALLDESGRDGKEKV